MGCHPSNRNRKALHVSELSESAIARLRSLIPSEGDGCREWAGCFNSKRRASKLPPYGIFYSGDRWALAHRLSFELENSVALDSSTVIRHRCDNPRCVRPEHLSSGTPSDNTNDMWSKGRGVPRPFKSGVLHHLAKMTPEKVREMRVLRDRGATLKHLAQQFGVNQSTVHDIVRRETWREVA